MSLLAAWNGGGGGGVLAATATVVVSVEVSAMVSDSDEGMEI